MAQHNLPPSPPDTAATPGSSNPLRRNWAGWYPDGDDLIFEQTGYDLRTPALGGLVGLFASLAVLVGLLALGFPGEPIRNGLYGALLLVTIIALVACATVARQTLRPVHRIARFARAKQSLIVRDVLALGIKRERIYPYTQLGLARTRGERVLTRPPKPSLTEPRHYLLAYPVMHIELERFGQPSWTLTTGALLSPQAAQRGADAINAHFRVARVPASTRADAATQAPSPVSSGVKTPQRPLKRAIPPRPLR